MQRDSDLLPQKESSASKVRGFFSRMMESFGEISDFLDEAWLKINHLTETNYELGLQMARAGRIEDAILRFRITLWIAPNHEPSMYNLACLYHHKGQNQKALALFSRIIKNNPRHANAIYMVASIDPSLLKAEMRPVTVPPIQVAEYFDTMAPVYDQSKAQEIYRLPAILHQLLRPALATDVARHDMLDIGCGTGLCGVQFAEEFANLVGVDVSSQMLDAAYRRVDRRGIKIYNQLVQQDIRHYLAQPDAPSYDVALAISVLPYIGDLQLLSQQLAHVIRSGGMVALSFDIYTDKEGYGVMPRTGYFGHSLAYVTQVMEASGFEMLRSGEVEAAASRFVQLCFFRKKPVSGNDNVSDSRT